MLETSSITRKVLKQIFTLGPGVPGPNHCYVRLYDTASMHKRVLMQQNPPPSPTFVDQPTLRQKDPTNAEETIAGKTFKKDEESYDDSLFKFDQVFKTQA